MPVVECLKGHVLADSGEASTMAEEPAHWELIFPRLRKFRPVARHGRVEVEQTALDKSMGANGDHPLCR